MYVALDDESSRAERGSMCSRSRCPYDTPCNAGDIERVLRVAPVGVSIVCLADSKIVWTNGAVPYSGGALERSLLDLVAPESRAVLGEALAAVQRGVDTERTTVHIASEQGARSAVEVVVTAAGADAPNQCIVFWNPKPFVSLVRDDDDVGASTDTLSKAMTAIAREVARAGYLDESLFTVSRLPRVELLSDREREIVTLLAQGYRSQAIGDRMFVSSSTIRNYLSAIYRKLGVTNQSELLEHLFADRG